MASLSRDNGAQNQVLRMVIVDNTGTPKTGLTNASTGLIIAAIADGEASATVYSASGSTIDTIATLGTYSAPTTGHCRFQQVDATNLPGYYELQLANTRYSVSNATYLDIAIQSSAASVPAQYIRIDLDAQVDVMAYGGTTATVVAGVPQVNMIQIAGTANRATKLANEMDGRVTGTVTTATFSATTTQAEFSDITDSATFSVYQNRGFLITSGAMVKGGGVILGDIVGTSGRRLTFSALPQAFASGDTIQIM